MRIVRWPVRIGVRLEIPCLPGITWIRRLLIMSTKVIFTGDPLFERRPQVCVEKKAFQALNFSYFYVNSVAKNRILFFFPSLLIIYRDDNL